MRDVWRWLEQVGFSLFLAFFFLIPVADLMQGPDVPPLDAGVALASGAVGIVTAFFLGRASRP